MGRKFIVLFIKNILLEIVLLFGFWLILWGWPMAAEACSGPLMEGHLCNPIIPMIPVIVGFMIMVVSGSCLAVAMKEE